MGSQRRLAESLMDTFLITEDTAWEWTRVFESAKIGDSISDAIYEIVNGDTDQGLRDLHQLSMDLTIAKEKIRKLARSVPRRKPA